MKFYLSLIFAFALMACSSHSEDPCEGPMISLELLVSGACVEHLSEDFGWQPAGFKPVIDNERGGSLKLVTHSKDWLVIRDNWTSPVEGKPNYLTFSPRVFVSKIGSSVWDTIAPPTDAYTKLVFADSSGLYVGTYRSGEIWMYSPESKNWKRLLKKNTDAGGWFNVMGIGRTSDRLVVSLAGYRDSLDEAAKRITTIIAVQKDSSWAEYEEEDGLQFYTTAEIFGEFFVAAYDLGVCKLNLNSGTYQQLAKFLLHRQTDSTRYTNKIFAHRGNLYAISFDEIYQWNGTNSWISIDSVHLKKVKDDVYYIETSAPGTVTSLASDGKHLFASGEHPFIPMVYMGDYGVPYENEPKGWRMLNRNWCTNKGKCQTGSTVQSLDVVGDTLYAAASDGLFKFPLAELDSAIANEDSYYSISEE